VRPDAGEAVPVRVEVALAVAPEAARHADPRLPDDQLADGPAHGLAVLVHHVRVHPDDRAGEGAGLERRQERPADDPAGDLGATGVVQDRLAAFEDVLEEPAPALRVPRAAGRADGAEAREV